MRVRRSKRQGARSEVLGKLDALGARCTALEQEVDTLSISSRLRQAFTRLAALEEQFAAQPPPK